MMNYNYIIDQANALINTYVTTNPERYVDTAAVDAAVEMVQQAALQMQTAIDSFVQTEIIIIVLGLIGFVAVKAVCMAFFWKCAAKSYINIKKEWNK